MVFKNVTRIKKRKTFLHLWGNIARAPNFTPTSMWWTGFVLGRSCRDFIVNEFSWFVIGRKLLRRRGRIGSRRDHRHRQQFFPGVPGHPGRRQATRWRSAVGVKRRRCRCPGTPRPRTGLAGSRTWSTLPALGLQGLQEEEYERRPAKGKKPRSSTIADTARFTNTIRSVIAVDRLTLTVTLNMTF